MQYQKRASSDALFFIPFSLLFSLQGETPLRQHTANYRSLFSEATGRVIADADEARRLFGG
ncbi:MAG: hypothetical protein CL388_09145 [Acidiferrobacteraceae bacterium]|jgi:hypothetical protein|nr:hypothetical protein [Acidiferrobacteraceae bacterium]MDP6434690.1 hypothetical protein [Arenicellales bacterium]MDP6671412.1 hypothetical protein [Arenicellales bacterium]|tara:strand:+ start:15589 stop:15771 length:183 start_codon:yes stop_codon:yes gene_type:complete